MAIAVVQETSRSQYGSASPYVSLAAGSSSGNGLTLIINAQGGAKTLNSVSDDQGNTWVIDDSAGTQGRSGSRVFAAHCFNPAASTQVVTAHFDVAAYYDYLQAYELSGMGAGSFAAKSATEASGASTLSNIFTPPTVEAFAMCCVGSVASMTSYGDIDGWTHDADLSVGNYEYAMSLIIAYSGSRNANVVASASTNISSIAYVYLAAVGATYNKIIAGSLSFSGVLPKNTGKITAGALSFAGAAIKSAQKTLAGTLNFAGGLSKTTLKLISGTLNFAGGTVKTISKNIAGMLSFVGTLSSIRTKIVIIAGTLSFGGSVVKSTFKNVAGSLSFTGSVVKTCSKLLSGSLSFSGSVIRSFSGMIANIIAKMAFSQRKRNAALTLSKRNITFKKVP